MTIKEIEQAVHVLKVCQYVWADNVKRDGFKISDYDAIDQVLKVLNGYRMSTMKLEEASKNNESK